MNAAYNMDCLEAMRQMPDKCFSLCVADPPYGIGASEMTMGKGKQKLWSKGKGWDISPPTQEYFIELLRVSKSAIIFGGNYFDLPKTKSWLIWDKCLYGKTSFADCEMAWTNIDTPARIIQCRYDGFLGADDDGRIHPCQKPIRLYDILFRLYAHSGDRVLDPNIGSGSSRIAAYKAGLDFVGFEIDKDYFDAQEKRFQEYTAQISLFNNGR